MHCIADLIVHIIPAVNIINNLSKLTDITRWVTLIELCDLTFGMYVYSHGTTLLLLNINPEAISIIDVQMPIHL